MSTGVFGTGAIDAAKRPLDEQQQERHKLRRMQAMMQLLLASIAQDRSMTIDEAAQAVANTRAAVLRMFPGKEATYNLLWRPRIQRAMQERFRIQ
jgi:hypothetical protein